MIAQFRHNYFSVSFAFVVCVLLVFVSSGASPTDVQAASSPKMLIPNAISAAALPFNGWLAFEATGDYAKTADAASELDLPSTTNGSFTIEASFQLSTRIYSFSTGYKVPILVKSGISLWVEKSCSVSYPFTCKYYVTYYNKSLGGATLYPTEFLPDRWYHIALAYDGEAKQARLYFDGVLLASNSETYAAGIPGNWAIGYFSSGLGSNLMQSVDEVRLSNSVRYTNSFSPATTPFVCDAYTMALWHFDELEGSITFHDSCGVEDNFLTGVNGAHAEGIPGYWVYLPLVVR